MKKTTITTILLSVAPSLSVASDISNGGSWLAEQGSNRIIVCLVNAGPKLRFYYRVCYPNVDANTAVEVREFNADENCAKSKVGDDAPKPIKTLGLREGACVDIITRNKKIIDVFSLNRRATGTYQLIEVLRDPE